MRRPTTTRSDSDSSRSATGSPRAAPTLRRLSPCAIAYLAIGATARLFPTLLFRRAYDALRDARGDRADVEYVRILLLAASTSERKVERALATLLGTETPFDYAAVKALAQPDEPTTFERRSSRSRSPTAGPNHGFRTGRAARTVAELGMGTLAPLATAIPEVMGGATRSWTHV